MASATTEAPSSVVGAGAHHHQQSIKGISSASNIVDASLRRIGIVHTQWNREVVDALVAGAVGELKAQGVLETNITVISVPGAYELPFGAKCLIEAADVANRVDAVICIGCLIKGETMHFEYICEGVTQGITRLNLETGHPVIFGVLAVLTEDQAKARAGLLPNSHNHGIEWAQSALQMAALRSKYLMPK